MEPPFYLYDAPSSSSAKRRMIEVTKGNRIGGGGEGEVYAIDIDPKVSKIIAVKVFKPQKLEKNGELLHKKISHMVKIGNKDKTLWNFPMVAWPKVMAYDEKGHFVGYGMQLAKGTPLTYLAHPQAYKDKFPDLDRIKVAEMLIRLWESVEFLHQKNIYIGDVNLNNVLCTEHYKPCWIDVDSFQIGKDFRCLVGRQEMTPPEHVGKDYSKIDRNRESDLFSLAILTFMCLMLGRHPYDHIGAGNPVDNLKKGYFPYVTGKGAYPGTEGGVPNGPWHKMWSHYTYRLMKLFVRALSGATDPFQRPSASEWKCALENLIKHYSYKPARRENGEEWVRSHDMIPKEEKPKDLVRRVPRSRS